MAKLLIYYILKNINIYWCRRLMMRQSTWIWKTENKFYLFFYFDTRKSKAKYSCMLLSSSFFTVLIHRDIPVLWSIIANMAHFIFFTLRDVTLTKVLFGTITCIRPDMAYLCVNDFLHFLVAIPVLTTPEYYPTAWTFQNFSKKKTPKLL